MSIKEAIDFETYYYHTLLETILKKSRDKLEEPLQQSVQNFVDFLSSEVSPLSGIEKLAHLQGTSDLSIFFSDLIERITEGQPDEAIQNMEEYARDFLEIFSELAKDEEWQRTILQDLLGQAPIPVALDQASEDIVADEQPLYNLSHFVRHQISEETSKEFLEKAPAALESLQELYKRLETGSADDDHFDLFRTHKSVLPLITAWGKLDKSEFSPQDLETYIGQFREHIAAFCQSLLHLYQQDETL